MDDKEREQLAKEIDDMLAGNFPEPSEYEKAMAREIDKILGTDVSSLLLINK